MPRIYTLSSETFGHVCGVQIRTCDVYPRELMAFADGTKLVAYFWQGAEVARVHWDGFSIDWGQGRIACLHCEGGVSRGEEKP